MYYLSTDYKVLQIKMPTNLSHCPIQKLMNYDWLRCIFIWRGTTTIIMNTTNKCILSPYYVWNKKVSFPRSLMHGKLYFHKNLLCLICLYTFYFLFIVSNCHICVVFAKLLVEFYLRRNYWAQFFSNASSWEEKSIWIIRMEVGRMELPMESTPVRANGSRCSHESGLQRSGQSPLSG